MEKVAAKKNDSLQVFRGLLFLMVFAIHVQCKYFPFNFLTSLFNNITPFFIMSGFLLMFRHSDDDSAATLKDCRDSLVKRIAKLYPLHIATMLWMIAVLSLSFWHGGVLKEKAGTLSFEALINVLLIQSWFWKDKVATSLNISAWYFSTAAFLYFCFPVIRRLVLKIGSGLKLAAFSVFLLLLQFVWACAAIKIEGAGLESFSFWALYQFPLYRLADFFVGCAAGFLYKKNEGRFELSEIWSAAAQIATALFAIFCVRLFSVEPENFFAKAFYKSSVAWVVISLAWVLLFVSGKGLLRVLTLRPLVAFGNISGLCYLIHWPVVYSVTQAMSLFDFSAKSELVKLSITMLELLATVALAIIWKRLFLPRLTRSPKVDKI